MDSGRKSGDRMSGLPDFLLAIIISNLSFKEAVATSSIAKRFKDIYHKTTNVSFIESEFVTCSVSYDGEEAVRDARVSFVRFMVDWASRFSGDAIESFHLCLSKPVEFIAEIKDLIEFAVSKRVKNLVLDFSDPSCTTRNYVPPTTSNQAAPSASSSSQGAAVVFQLPECVYNETTVESLKLIACGFDPSKFAKPCSFKSLSFSWIDLGKIMHLLSKSPLLESLSLQNCWNVGLESITDYNSRLRELIFENCEFAMECSLLDVPNIQIFKYSGNFHFFQFLGVNRIMEEAYLDFGAERETDREMGTILCDLLYDLLSARKLTVCPYLITAIRHSDEPARLKAPMETRHLVIKTNLIPDEFVGIRLMINSSPELETLTFSMRPPVYVPRTNPGFHPKTYWTHAISHECLQKTLKVVEVRNFTGKTYELPILRYLIQWGQVLEIVDLYLPSEITAREMAAARVLMRKLREEGEAASGRLWIRLREGRRKDKASSKKPIVEE